MGKDGKAGTAGQVQEQQAAWASPSLEEAKLAGSTIPAMGSRLALTPAPPRRVSLVDRNLRVPFFALRVNLHTKINIKQLPETWSQACLSWGYLASPSIFPRAGRLIL